MSGRTIPRFVLVGLLAVACAVPIRAQFSPRQLVIPTAQVPSSQPPAAIEKPTAGKLTGTWYREIDGAVVAATFADDELKLCTTINVGGTLIQLTFTADYAVTKDGLIHGAITGVDWNVKPKKKADEQSLDVNELLNLGAQLETLIDCPFSCRTRSTSVGLMVSNMKAAVGDLNGSGNRIFSLITGMYTFSKDGTVPTAKPALPMPSHMNYGGMTLPSPRYLDHYPQYFAPDPNHPLPRELSDLEDPQSTARRAGLPASNTPPPMTTPVPPDVPQSPQPRRIQQSPPDITPAVQPQPPTVQSQPLTTAPIQRVADSVPVLIQPSATPLPATGAKPGIVGTWYREFGSKLCVIKIAPDYLTMTISQSQELEGGKILTAEFEITAEYHITQNGITTIGLVTCVDFQLLGDIPDEIEKSLVDIMQQNRKSLENKPFALTLRLYGDSLTVGNMQMPELPDELQEFDFDSATILSGRYKSLGDKPRPKPKVVKAEVQTTYSTDPNVRMQKLLNESADLRQSEQNWRGTETSPGTPQMVQPTVPVPTMTELTPPASETTPSTNSSEKKVPAIEISVFWKNQIQYLPDPARNGELGAGLLGHLFLFDSKLASTTAEGRLIVDIFDETPRPQGQSANKRERWMFTKESLSKLVTTDERFGKCYALFLPWPTYTADVTQVRIAVRFDPEDGLSLNAPVTTMKLEARPKSCSADVGTGVGLTPASPIESPKSDTMKAKKQPSLFFVPRSKQAPESKLSPERIHGGIIRLIRDAEVIVSLGDIDQVGNPG